MLSKNPYHKDFYFSSKVYKATLFIIKHFWLLFFRKFTLLCAMSNSKCVSASFYKEGGITKERFVEFLEAYIFNKYKNRLIILDNVNSYNNEYVKQSIINSCNKYLFTIPYTPKTNPMR
jgi:hypothetical protein